MRLSASLIIGLWLGIHVGTAHGQAPQFNRFTDELSQALETDAASALMRQMYVEVVRVICGRTLAAEADAMNLEARNWTSRNEPYIKLAGAAIAAIGNRHIPVGGVKYQQSYFNMILRQSIAKVSSEAARDFGGATPDNSIVPPANKCMEEANRLGSGSTDFKSTPGVVLALTEFGRKTSRRQQ